MIINLRIVKLLVTTLVKPVVTHEAPPFVDFKTPILLVSPASPSPVAKYMILVLVGSIARSEQPITDKLSVLVVHEFPPLVDFHKPPAGAPTHKLFEFVGSMVIKFILPDFKN